jgi:hypothetical protein
MITQDKLLALIADIRVCSRRARELAEPEAAGALQAIADELQRATHEETESDRPSLLPPVLASNVETRATATKHFQKTREILRGIR